MYYEYLTKSVSKMSNLHPLLTSLSILLTGALFYVCFDKKLRTKYNFCLFYLTETDKGQVQAYGWIPGETGQPGDKDNLLPSYKIRDIKCVWNKILLLTHDDKALIWNNVTEEGSTPVSFPSIPSLQLEENQNADIRFKFINCSEKHCLVVTGDKPF